MPRSLTRALVAAATVAISSPSQLAAQGGQRPSAITIAGAGANNIVLLSGLVGGVAGFRRLEGRLVDESRRVIVIDPYLLSIDSADVSFAALARRVDRVLDSLGVTSARVVGHAHGGGVALRLAANASPRVSELYLLDVGALPEQRTSIFSGSLRLVPLVARIPGGRAFIRRRLINGLRENAGRHEWLDGETQRAYTDPMLREIGRVVSLALRLADARERDSLPTLIARVRVPVTVILGDAPRPAGPGPQELIALEPLGTLLRVERLHGVGHFPHEEAPAEVASVLLGATSQVVAGPAGSAR